MANITSADVTYLFGGMGQTNALLGLDADVVLATPARERRRVILLFPTSAVNTTYPAGGVPLLPVTMSGRLRGVISSIKVVSQAPIAGDTNPLWMWNGSTVAPKLVGYQASAGGVGVNPFREYATTIAQNAAVVALEIESG